MNGKLESIDFGLGAAQQEVNLKEYFYRSTSFDEASSGKTYLILGPKGAGKSAIFQMLYELRNDINIFKKPNLWLREEPILRDHWATLNPNVSTSRVALWRFYIASLIADRLLNEDNLPVELRKSYERFLVRWNLVREIPTAWQAYRKLKFKFSIAGYVSAEFPPKIPLSPMECDQVIYTANAWLEEQGADIWICLDSLDTVSINGPDEEQVEELLSDLMRAVGEIIRLKTIKFKLFFRTDIYDALTWVNKDHFSALKHILKWSKEDIGILLGHRIATLHPDHDGDIKYPLAKE